MDSAACTGRVGVDAGARKPRATNPGKYSGRVRTSHKLESASTVVPAASRDLRKGRLRAHLSATTAVAALLAATSSYAQDASWTGGGAPVANEWSQGNNWTPPPVPTGTATFTNNGAPTSVIISANTTINTMQFTAGAPAYTFTSGFSGSTFNIVGQGIVNDSAVAPHFINLSA
jgi:hypothetical protein